MLNKDEILKRTNNGLDVFKHYIPGQWRVGRNFLNPLYEDRKASCNIYFDRRSDCYRVKDFGNDTYSGDCFDTVGRIKGLNCGNPADFVEILKTINRELSLYLDEHDQPFVISGLPKPVRKQESPQQPETPKKTKPYSVV
ncbi:MAG: hypothetical protein LBR10_13050 [Prevotellaceae bacterium]|jgi:hypothetical protein|nr:hypothetical protein [Prevotellaceae bacterium]